MQEQRQVQAQHHYAEPAPERRATVPSLAEVAAATAIKFSDDDRRVMRESFCQGASDAEFRQLCAIAEARGLNPLAGQCHFVKRWNSQQRHEVWAVQVSIDGMRSIAAASGVYDGQDEAEFEVDAQGRPTVARVRVYRKDWSRPVVGVAYWDEFVVTNKEGAVTSMWRGKPRTMLAKCAEAQAHRKAFPLPLGGLYTPEEISAGTAADEPEESPARGASGPASEFVARISVADDAQALTAIGLEVRKAGLRGGDAALVREAYAARQRELRAAAKARASQPQAAEPPPEEMGDAYEPPLAVDPETGEVAE